MDINAVKRFLRRQFFVAKDDGPVVKLECFHIGTNKRNAPPTWEETFAPSQQVDETSVDRLVDDIDKVTQDEADQLDGVQQYILYAYRERTGDRATARFPIRQTGDSDEDQDNPNPQSEPASLQGVLAQQMRHNEALVRTSVGGWRDVINVLQKQAARLADQNEFLQQKLMDMRTTVEVAESTREARLAERSEREARERRQDQLFDTFLPLLPAAVNMLSGKKLLPESTTPERMMVRKFFETVTPEQFKKMREVLDPEQYGIVVVMLTDIQEGIDSNLPTLFKRFLESTPASTAERLKSEVFSMGQIAAVQTMIESLARSEAAREAKAAEAKKNGEGAKA
jgi:hypothetical protein